MTVPEDTAVSGAGDTQVNDVVDGEVNGNGNGDDVVGAGMTTEKIIPESDLGLPDRRIWVVTTASLPWRTGTAVNPLARALYLTKGRPADYVTLLIPWLTHKEDQTKLFGADCTFESEEDQAKWIREYCMNRVLAGSDGEFSAAGRGHRCDFEWDVTAAKQSPHSRCVCDSSDFV